MAEGAEYPKAIYRDGGADLIWGNPVETRAVHSADEEARMIREGWRLHPVGSVLDHDGDGKPGGSLDAWDQMDTDALRVAAQERGLALHHKTGRDKLLIALREANNGD